MISGGDISALAFSRWREERDSAILKKNIQMDKHSSSLRYYVARSYE